MARTPAVRRSSRSARGVALCAFAASILLTVSACGGAADGGASTHGAATGGGTTSSAAAGTPQRGGTVTALEDSGYAGTWPAGLDPATSPTGASNSDLLQPIFGGLFLLRADDDGSNARIAPYQARSGTLSKDAKTLTIKLRPGITFSDGTPLNAKAVIWNFRRDDGSSCTCAPQWQVRKKDPFTSPDPLTVVVHLTKPNAAILRNFPISNVNWIASPTSYKRMGAKAFALKPVGAGPFTVVSDRLSSQLVLKRNPDFFVKGQPYLDRLIFKSIGGDQPAYQAMLAGQAQAYLGMSTAPVIEQAKKNPKLQVTEQPGTTPYVVQVNTQIPPFDNIKARTALYYATDWDAINKGLFNGTQTVVQGFTTPADMYYHQKTPGYRTYDLAKAKALVKQLGGLHVKLQTMQAYSAIKVMTALQTQWERAGIKVKTHASQLNEAINAFNSGKWQAFLQTAGSWDPAVGVGMATRFGSQSSLSGVKDTHLDSLIEKGVSTSVDSERDKIYQQIAKYISDKAYAEFGFAVPTANIAAKGVHGPGLTTKIPALILNTAVIWSEVWTENG